MALLPTKMKRNWPFHSFGSFSWKLTKIHHPITVCFPLASLFINFPSINFSLMFHHISYSPFAFFGQIRPIKKKKKTNPGSLCFAMCRLHNLAIINLTSKTSLVNTTVWNVSSPVKKKKINWQDSLIFNDKICSCLGRKKGLYTEQLVSPADSL